ncbi:MAG TPA: Uma2 family endonuclease [Thermoanaerobaculia bacterium]|nr:Uma2 family endonuclease [Thermoanaerobaculia bacterium]
MSTPESALVSPTEYLEIERNSEIRHEYVNGRMYEMSGASDAHSLIGWNLIRVLSNQIGDRPCRVYYGDMRVKVSPTGMYTYPDIAALCDKPRLENFKGIDTLLNPSVIIEVLSHTTESYDRGDKFEHYRRLESLQEYVLVPQHRMRVEQFVRDGADWRLSELSDPQALLRLAPIGCEISLADIYRGVEFPSIESSRWPR